MPTILDIRHPQYNQSFEDWIKFRLAYEGGRSFIDRYLIKLSVRETDDDFLARKQLAYVPAYASAAITEIKNSIFQRTADVQRVGGPPSYQKALTEYVDLEGNNINSFFGMLVLEELLVLGRVGVLTDMPDFLGTTLLDKGDKRPYLGVFCCENIMSWSYKTTSTERYLTAIKLKEYVETIDEESGLVTSSQEICRHMKLTNSGVLTTFYNDKSEPIRQMMLELDRIPFTLFELPFSLMTNVADYQIALMNLESSDISFARKANFPIYYEFFDPKAEQVFKKPPGPPNTADGTSTVQGKSKDKETEVGLTKGRRIPFGLNAPGFVAPDPETLRVSMEKGRQLRDDIYNIVNLNVSNLSSSAESKQADKANLESGLSFIGLVLEKGETDIGRHWAAFEGTNDKPKITYPKNYSLESDEERRKKAEHLEKMSNKIPSPTYRKAVMKRMAKVTIGASITEKDLSKINSEIDRADTLTCDPDQIKNDVELGLVTKQTASVARGYKPDEVEKAKVERAEDIRLTLEAQGGPENASAARGAKAFGGATGSAEKEGKNKRGKADVVIPDEEDD